MRRHSFIRVTCLFLSLILLESSFSKAVLAEELLVDSILQEDSQLIENPENIDDVLLEDQTKPSTT